MDKSIKSQLKSIQAIIDASNKAKKNQVVVISRAEDSKYKILELTYNHKTKKNKTTEHIVDEYLSLLPKYKKNSSTIIINDLPR